MSHNTLEVSGNEPDVAGSISVPGVFSEIRIGGDNLSDNYSNSPATALNNSVLYFYDTSPINTIAGATISSSSGWVDSVTLPPGTYLLQASFAVVFTATGQFAFQWFDGSTSRGTRAQLGGTISHATESVSPLATLCISVAEQTTFSCKSTSNSTNLDTLQQQGTTPSEQSSMQIRKLQ